VEFVFVVEFSCFECDVFEIINIELIGGSEGWFFGGSLELEDEFCDVEEFVECFDFGVDFFF